MKEFFKRLFKIHGAIGKVLTFICVTIVAAVILGIVIGTTKIVKRNEVVETNYFIKEDVPVHSKNYIALVNKATNLDETVVLNKEKEETKVKGNFICVNISISQKDGSSIKPHKFDANDFKLKDHTGIYIPLNKILGAVNWDGIDVHIDNAEGGHVISSTEFSTINSYQDFNYIDHVIYPGYSFTFNLLFKTDNVIDVSKELTVLEVDFFIGKSDYKKGTDIILLNRPDDLKRENRQ